MEQSNQVPWKCPICWRRFQTFASFREHMDKHQRPQTDPRPDEQAPEEEQDMTLLG